MDGVEEGADVDADSDWDTDVEVVEAAEITVPVDASCPAILPLLLLEL